MYPTPNRLAWLTCVLAFALLLLGGAACDSAGLTGEVDADSTTAGDRDTGSSNPDTPGGEDGDATTPPDGENPPDGADPDGENPPDVPLSETDGGGETGPDADVDEPDTGPSEPEGYPAAGDELLIRITSPSGGPRAAVLGSIITVGGLLFGDADSITWQTDSGLSGEIAEAPFWGSSKVDLEPGDNLITVTAAKGATVVSDSIVVTYNPGFKFDGPLFARPNVAWMGVASETVFTIPIGLYANFNAQSITLHQVDGNGLPVSQVGKMVDDGAVGSSGDEIQSDGVFTRKHNFTCNSPEPLYFRVSVEVQQGTAPSYTAWSPAIPIWCVEHFEAADCQGHQAIIQQAEQQATSGSSPEDIAAALKANPQVADAGVATDGGYSVWIQFESGVLGAVLLTPPGKRGSGGSPPAGGFVPPNPPLGNIVEVGTRSAIVLAPFYAEFGATDDGPAVAASISISECPAFTVESGMALQGAAANLDRFRDLWEYGLASISSHGEALFETLDPADKADLYHWDHSGSQEVLWSGEGVLCNQLLQTQKSCTVTGENPTGGCPPGTICLVTKGTGGSSSQGLCLDRTQADLRLGRVVMTNKGYAMTPAFFEAYAAGGYPSSLVNLGACRTFFNGSLATTFFAFGAKAITGFSDYVESAWAFERVKEMFEGAVGKGLIGEFHKGGEDPDNPGTHWRLLGASNLDLARADIINASFENGDPTGWRTDGDGRVVSQLGSSIPVHGKFMGLLSTGLGYTVQTGMLEQDFCITSDKTAVEVYWKFFSEEFKEYCGSSFQDTFQAVLTGAGGQLTLVDVKVDDLCGYGDGSCGSCPNPTACDIECMGGGGCIYDPTTATCSGTYPCTCGKYFVGLTPSDVSFDRGGVFNILWQKTSKNVIALAGAGKVNLRLYATDTGDSIYDTVILIDSIRFL